jgi:prevent-host-death family protein
VEKTVGAFEAKTHFSELLDRAERGEEILITKRGKAVARLMPVAADAGDGVAVKALARMRKRAKATGIKRFDWKEWKKYVEEGRR